MNEILIKIAVVLLVLILIEAAHYLTWRIEQHDEEREP